MKIGILGGGVWGSALAKLLSYNKVTIFARDSNITDSINNYHFNPKLKYVVFNNNVSARGGGINLSYPAGNQYFNNLTIVDNYATNYGSGINFHSPSNAERLPFMIFRVGVRGISSKICSLSGHLFFEIFFVPR